MLSNAPGMHVHACYQYFLSFYCATVGECGCSYMLHIHTSTCMHICTRHIVLSFSFILYIIIYIFFLIQGAELDLRRLSKSDSGVYTCHVQVRVGSPVTKQFNVYVKGMCALCCAFNILTSCIISALTLDKLGWFSYQFHKDIRHKSHHRQNLNNLCCKCPRFAVSLCKVYYLLYAYTY